MATEISPLIVDPATLLYETFSVSRLTQILTELGEKDPRTVDLTDLSRPNHLDFLSIL